jgi:NAD(P)-dependent dehydrogenase (short-subunit alcohol dehydrogenase family)
MKDRVAVVTGANRGIGAEITRQLREQGMRVIPASREPRDGFATLDVTRAEHIDALARRLAEEGGVDALVNNGGVSLDGFDAEVARRTLAVNFHGAMHLTDALLPSMRSGGRIVMISSGMGELSGVRGEARARIADPALTREGLIALVESFVTDVAAGTQARRGWPSNAYSVSKIALNALVRVLAKELAGDPRRILVNSENPGWVRTRMGGRSAPRSVEDGARTAVWLATLPDGGPNGGFFRDEQAIPW